MKEYIERAVALEALSKSGVTCNMRAHKIVASIQAADVVEVRHGYWIDHHSGGSFCSACKRWVPYSHHPKYCEKCGARMDKEEEHEAG